MQSSSARVRGSAAHLAGAAVVAAITLAYLPIPVASTPLVENPSLPTPILTSVAIADAQTRTGSQSNSSASGSLTGQVVSITPSGTRLVIPAINLNDPIVPVGLTAGGAMAVPNGRTNEVGWYDGGPRPGDAGSAVLDAHVFAAFSKLKYLSVGDSIYVQESGQTLHFVVTAVREFALSQITSYDLFTPTSNRDLNLITCAGRLTPDHSTYDHRLVVYATLES